MSAPAATLDPARWRYRLAYRPVARAVSAYHRTRMIGTPHRGRCIYVTHHGAGYLNLDLALAVYFLAWRDWWAGEGPPPNLRIAAAVGNAVERAVPGLAHVKREVGLIDPSEASCLRALEAGHQLLITPGGRRESMPRARTYRLRWDDRYGFARLALRTGVPIVPLAVVGGFDAYPGFSVGKWSFWSPIPLPARMRIAVGDPIAAAPLGAEVPDMHIVKAVQQRARLATQALYDALLAARRPLREAP